MSTSLYEADFLAWTERQAALLRQGRLAEADIGLIAEEIETLGRSEKRELVGRLRVLLCHLYQWQFQPERRGVSWRLSIANARDELAIHLRDNPSLGAVLPLALDDASRDVAAETGLPVTQFPQHCPWLFPQLLDESFWPGQG